MIYFNIIIQYSTVHNTLNIRIPIYYYYLFELSSCQSHECIVTQLIENWHILIYIEIVYDAYSLGDKQTVKIVQHKKLKLFRFLGNVFRGYFNITAGIRKKQDFAFLPVKLQEIAITMIMVTNWYSTEFLLNAKDLNNLYNKHYWVFFKHI